MAEITYNIYEIEPNGLSGFKALPPEDVNLITSTEVSKTFKPNDNFIELSFFTLDNNRLETIPTYDRYSILSGDRKQGLDGNSEIGIDVQGDYLAYGYGSTEGKLLYNFLDYPYSNTAIPQDFYIESISTDRTELRLVSVNLDSSTVLDTTKEIKTLFDGSAYIPDFHLYFGSNIFFSIVNIDAKSFRETTAVIVKLLEPLPRTIGVKATLNIVEKVSDSIAYEINTVVTPEKKVTPTLRGANFAIDLDAQTTEPSQYFNYNELFSFASYNSYREINSLFNEKGAELGIDYSDFANFINFSSAEERLRNFRYKLQLLESYQTQLDVIQGSDPDLANSTPPLGYTGTGVTGTTQYWESLIEGIINNFDHYERHLFYENESSAWPKQNTSTVTSKPYQNVLTTNASATAWYNAELQDAILFDAQNGDLLRNTVPSYLIEDPDNRPYELIVHMVAQHFDNIWIYTNQVSEKYDADNRLDRGASKDLIEDLLKNFGVKLYTSNKSVEDLFRYFTTNSYDRGNESITGSTIGTGQESVSQNDYQKEIYKRIYHNLPLLMKSKGTERGLRALINCFGIPSDVLKVRVFGGESSEEFPFFGGQQAITGSIDKVRLDNTGSIAPGDTVSFYTSIINQNNEYTPDLHRIEVGFSPAYNINEYIVSQSAELFPNIAFDIDDYIGDPRGYETNKYPPLYAYAETILANIDAYNLKDFVRLIKFFDNVLFRMVRDFTPARAVTDAGIIIKPHLLDRSKFKSPRMTWTRPEYSGSIDTAFITGSNAGAYKSVGFGSGSNNESIVNYRRKVQTPTGLAYKSVNYTDATQVEKMFGEAKIDGELSGSIIKVTNGELNEDNPYLDYIYPSINYNVQFLNEVPADFCILSIPPSSDITQEYNPFIVSNGAIINIPATNIFLGDNDINYSFLVGNGISPTSFFPPNNDGEFVHEFVGEQYELFTVKAQHIDSSVPNTLTGEPCQAERTIRIVTCALLDEAENNSPSQVTVNTIYDIHGWFFPLDTGVIDIGSDFEGYINSELFYFVNDEYIGSVINAEGFPPDSSLGGVGNNPRSYIFNDIPLGTNNIEVKVTDKYDNLCFLRVNPQFNTCTLGDSSANIPDSIRDTTILAGNNNVFSIPFGFLEPTLTTKYYFRLRVELYENNNPNQITNWPANYINSDDPNARAVWGPGRVGSPDAEDYPYSDDYTLGLDSSWTEIEDTDNLPIGALTTLPTQYLGDNGIIAAYPEANPERIAPGLWIDGQFVINSIDNPPAPSAVGGTLAAKNFKRYIQFLAVTNENCFLVGREYLIYNGGTERREVEFLYAPIVPTNPYVLCSITQQADPSNTVTAWVTVPEDSSDVSPGNVLSNRMKIYKYGDINDDTPAEQGYYGNRLGSGDNTYIMGRHWGQNDSSGTFRWYTLALIENFDFYENILGDPGRIRCVGDGAISDVEDGEGWGNGGDYDSDNTSGGTTGGGGAHNGFG